MSLKSISLGVVIYLNYEIVYKKIYADFKYEISDHIPIFIEINLKKVFRHSPYDLSRIIPRWSVADATYRNAYKKESDNLPSLIQEDVKMTSIST